MIEAACAVGAGQLERFAHGTTIATNALLERKGARTAFVTTAGFEHLLYLRRRRGRICTGCVTTTLSRSFRSSDVTASPSESDRGRPDRG